MFCFVLIERLFVVLHLLFVLRVLFVCFITFSAVLFFLFACVPSTSRATVTTNENKPLAVGTISFFSWSRVVTLFVFVCWKFPGMGYCNISYQVPGSPLVLTRPSTNALSLARTLISRAHQPTVWTAPTCRRRRTTYGRRPSRTASPGGLTWALGVLSRIWWMPRDTVPSRIFVSATRGSSASQRCTN